MPINFFTFTKNPSVLYGFNMLYFRSVIRSGTDYDLNVSYLIEFNYVFRSFFIIKYNYYFEIKKTVFL